MPQNLSNYIREIWAPQVQQKLFQALVGKEICEFITVGDGDTIHKPYHSDLATGTYTRNPSSGGVAETDITTTDEYLTIGTSKYASFFVDKLDNLQMFYKSLKGDLMKEAAIRLATDIDTAIFAEYANAELSVDGGDVGGTDGQPISLAISGTNGHILDVFEAAKAKLAGNNVAVDGDWFMVVDSANYYKVLERYLLSAGFKVQDEALVNGYVGKVSGINLYISNNLPTSTVSGSTARHWLAGKRGAITLAIQSDASLDTIDNPSLTDGTHKLRTKYIVSNLFGKKTFYWNAKKLVDIQIAA